MLIFENENVYDTVGLRMPVFAAIPTYLYEVASSPSVDFLTRCMFRRRISIQPATTIVVHALYSSYAAAEDVERTYPYMQLTVIKHRTCTTTVDHSEAVDPTPLRALSVRA